MCGRFSLAQDPAALAELLGLTEPPELAPRYNVSPGQLISVLRAPREGSRQLEQLSWGFVPAWADDPGSRRPINARADTVAEKPSFRAAFQQRRCLIPADGFYEWQTQGTKKIPMRFHMEDGRPFAMAGLWEAWRGRDGERLETCLVLTTEPNVLVAPVHDRMPVILSPADFAAWLDPRTPAPHLQALMVPRPEQGMRVSPANPKLGSVQHDDPSVLVPEPEGPSQLSLF